MKTNKTHTNKQKNIISLAKESLRYILHFSFFIFHFSFLGSCIYDDYENGSDTTVGEEKEVTISISVPKTQNHSTTRALDSTDEDRINSIELLVYDNTTGNFDYISHGIDITDQGSTDLKSFQVLLKTGTSTITLLANCRDILQQLYPSGIPAGTPKAQIEEKIKLTQSGKWNTSPATSGYIDIPMWGELPGPVIINSSTNNLNSGNPINLYRMLATVDVATSLTDPSIFTLTSVRVYNIEMEGAIIPSGLSTPTIPTTSTPVKGPLVYDDTAITTDPAGQNACTGQIYLFETKKGGKATHPGNPCLVVGGIYQGKEVYYRIDFQTGQTYLDILRNHRYQVLITGVNDKGFQTPDEAYESIPVGIQSQIIDWSAGSNSDISVGGKYLLKVSTDELTFNPTGGTQIIYIHTDHPAGWDLVPKTPLPSWITFSVTHGDAPDYTEVRVTVDDYDQDGPRSYEIPVIVDNVEKTLRFAQLGKNDAAIEIFATPTQILFPRGPSEPTRIQVSTYPFNLPLHYSWSGDTFDWDIYPTDGIAVNEILLQPKANTTGIIRSGILTITARDTQGQMATCLIYISQADKMTGFDYQLNNPYPYLPGTYNFNVTSSVAWQVNNVNMPSEWTARFTGQQTATPSGQTYQFDLAGNPLHTDREIEVIFHSTDNGESTTAVFLQEATPPVLSAPDGTQELTVVFPTEAGKTVKLQFLANVPWELESNMDLSNVKEQLNSQYHSSYSHQTYYPVTQPIWTPETVELEYTTLEYPWTNQTPYGGRVIGMSNRTVRNSEHSKTLTLYLSRIVPYMARISTSMNSSTVTTYEASSNSGAGSYGVNMSADENGWLHSFPAGETLLSSLRLATNTSLIVWTSLAPDQKFTYTHLTNSALSTSANVANQVIIPENKSGSPRNFIIYLQKRDGVIEEIPCIQHGENPTFTYTVECENGTVPLDTYLSTHNNIFPTGGLVINVTATGFEQAVYVMGIMDGGIEEHYSLKYNKRISTNGGSIKYTVRPNPGSTGVNRTYGLSYASSHTSVNRTGAQAAMQRESSHPRSPYKEIQQNHRNYELTTTGRIVARGSLYNTSTTVSWYYTLYGVSWETAAGVDGYATTTLTNLTGYTPVTSTNPASCAAYSEWDDGGKPWRLPTEAELLEMYNKRYEIGGFYSDQFPASTSNLYYWAIDNTGNMGRVVEFGSGGSKGTGVNNLKSSLNARVRCVRDK